MVANALAQALAARRFFWSLEFIPSVERILRDDLAKLGGIAAVVRAKERLATFAVTDRVVSERDPEPVAAAASLGDSTDKQPLVHFSGKGRELGDLDGVVERMQANGLENLLVLTGDRLKVEPAGRRARYLESVPALARVRHLQPRWLLACALNPFKYREEDGMAQLYKLGRKVEAGADFVITQIGLDPAKHDDAAAWVNQRGYRTPLVANVMLLPAARARFMRRHELAGITITDSLMAMLEAEAATLPDKGATRVLRRLALQIVGVELAGYAGVQITGLHAPDKVAALEEAVKRAGRDCPDRASWNEAWREAMTAPGGGVADPVPPDARWRLGQRRTVVAGLGERIRYRGLEAIHAAVFEHGPLAACFGVAMRPLAGRERSLAGRVVHLVERAVKAPVVGCETCGSCRLAATLYVCPETCPKGLANGPCGGTTQNRCEFGDRECIHSVKLRIAASAGVEEQLGSGLVPAVPAAGRHTTSWPSHFAGRGRTAERLALDPDPVDVGQGRAGLAAGRVRE
jgi:methylenetetrahydrofolate reductase (NADPH)